MCRSLPQIPAYSTFKRTSSGDISGTGISRISSLAGSAIQTLFMYTSSFYWENLDPHLLELVIQILHELGLDVVAVLRSRMDEGLHLVAVLL